MKITGRKKLTDFAYAHSNVRSQLDTWVQQVREAEWKNSRDVKARYPSADFFKNNRVVINIKGNHYRLLFQVNYDLGIVHVKAIGKHDEYNKWDLS